MKAVSSIIPICPNCNATDNIVEVPDQVAMYLKCMNCYTEELLFEFIKHTLMGNPITSEQPPGPTKHDVYFNKDENKFYYFDGSVWLDIVPSDETDDSEDYGPNINSIFSDEEGFLEGCKPPPETMFHKAEITDCSINKLTFSFICQHCGSAQELTWDTPVTIEDINGTHEVECSECAKCSEYKIRLEVAFKINLFRGDLPEVPR